MKPLLEKLKEQNLVCDGAMGTSLQQEGLGVGEVPEQWNITHPDVVRSVHKGYLDAGADIIITNTFGANRLKLKRAGLQERIEEFNRAGAKLAREVTGNRAYVLGDIGPTGEFMEPIGDISYDEFYEVFKEQAQVLKSCGVDGIMIETFTDLGELKAAVLASQDTGGVPVIANMTFQPTQKGYRTIMGISVEQAVEEMINLRCRIIGSNCGCGMAQMVDIMALMRKHLDELGGADIFLMAQPNAGMPKLEGERTVFQETPADFARLIPKLIAARVNIVGGCCGTNPDHIREIAKIVKTKTG